MKTTIEIFKRINAIDWFSCCGQQWQSRDFPFEYLQVPGWNDAIDLCAGQNWDLVTMNAHNSLTSHLHQVCRDAYQHWNRIIRDAKIELIPGWQILELRLQQRNLDSVIGSRVRWDTLNAAMEEAYKEFNPPTFYMNLLRAYEAGHFPCGWEGDFPAGRLLVL